MCEIEQRTSGRARLSGGMMVGLAVGLLAACSPDGLVGNAPLPSDLTNPNAMHTPAGAVAAYQSALVQLRVALGGRARSFVAAGAMFADELQYGNWGGANPVPAPFDMRTLPESNDIDDQQGYWETYSEIHRVRGQAREAIGLLTEFAPESSPALRGHLYAAMGYAEVMLAELFCSGIPLSTLDYDGDYTLTRGLTTDEVLQHALALFDTTLTLSSDSARVLNLARVGRARALVDLGELAQAAEALAEVPDGYRYEVQYPAEDDGEREEEHFAYAEDDEWFFTVADREGQNGLDYISSGDPRTAVREIEINNHDKQQYHPVKYSMDGDSPIVLAGGVEARLIEAEAQLRAGGASWLATLNALRTDGTFTTQPNADDPIRTDTLWRAGTGGIDGLAPLEDPGTPDARVDLVFHERAFWLFLTGHRLGDLRRLVRQYGRDAESVYPTGIYSSGNDLYGTGVNLPIPAEEQVSNPLFTGCINRGA